MTVPSQTRHPEQTRDAAGDLVHLRRAGVSLLLDGSDYRGAGGAVLGRRPRVRWPGGTRSTWPSRCVGRSGTAYPTSDRSGSSPSTPTPGSAYPACAATASGAGLVAVLPADRDARGPRRGTSARWPYSRVDVTARDDAAALDLRSSSWSWIRWAWCGCRAEVRNAHPTEPVPVERARCSGLPVPAQATELLDLTGRLRERARSGIRSPSAPGCGRAGAGTGQDATLLLAPGRRASASGPGRCGGCTSGGAATTARSPSGTPAGQAVLGRRRTAAARRDPAGPRRHLPLPLDLRLLRAPRPGRTGRPLPPRAARPRRGTQPPPRPVTLNTWEAVYFDHDLAKLTARWRTRPQRSEPSGSCWTTGGSGGAGTTVPGSVTGMWTRRSGRTGCIR